MDLKWRTPCKIIAIIDGVLSSISVVMCLLTFVVLFTGKEYLIEELDKEGEGDEEAKQAADLFRRHSDLMVTMMAVILGISVVLGIIVMMAAKKLYVATQESSVSIEDKRKGLSFYRILSIVIFVLCILAIASVKGGQGTGMFLLAGGFRGVAILVVSLFMKELKSAEAAPPVYYDVGKGV